MSLSNAELSSAITDRKEDEPLKMFFTTSHLLNTMNSALDKLTTDQDDASPRFELQKRLPDGSTVKADARDMAVADMESKFTQAAKEVEDLSPSQRLEWAELQRQAGNKFYRKKEYEEAIDVYLTCLVVKSETPEFLEHVFLPVMNNLAQCTLQMGSYKKAQTFCTMALEEKDLPNRPEMISKLYFRRGKARRLSGDYLGCKEDLEKAIELLPQHLVAEHRSIEKELHLGERSFLEGKRNEVKQQVAMKEFFDSATTASAAGPIPSRETPQAFQSKVALYGNQRKKYSTVRARREGNDLQGHVRAKELNYWQYYLAVIGSIAEQFLLLLGDEETIANRNELLTKEA
jgi:tetratricopeptide (TPR) repeat protein